MTEIISLFLSARPSITEGFSRLFDFGGTLNEYNSSPSEEQADEMAFRADIEALRRDVAVVKKQLSSECNVEV